MSIIICLFIILTSFTFNYNVNALEYYNSVDIETYFDESISVDSIGTIEISINENEEENYYDLKSSADFKMSVSAVAKGELSFNYGIVDDDTEGYYKVTADITYDELNNTALIRVYVSLQNNTRYNITSTDTIKSIRESEEQTTTSSVNNNSTNYESTTTSQSNGGITIDNNKPTTTTTSNIVEEEETDTKEDNRKKNDTIFIIIYSILGIVLIVGLFIAFVNIIKANK